MFKWFQNWRDKFIEDCRHWWKLWSSWLALAWGAIITALWNEPQVFQEIANVMPAEYRALLSPLVFFIISGLPIFVRLLKQQKLVDAMKDQKGPQQ